MHNYVPVKENMMERHIKTQGTYPDCGVQDEIVYHVLIIVLLLPCFGGHSMKCLILNCLDCILLHGALIYWIIHCPAPNRGPILCGMWADWAAHNERRHGETKMNLIQACRWVKELSSDLIVSSESMSEKKDNAQIMNWKLPPARFVKINVDTTFKAESQQVATGVIIRDENGQVLAAKCKWYGSIPNILSVEAYAATDGAVLMDLLNRPKVMMETDSLGMQSL